MSSEHVGGQVEVLVEDPGVEAGVLLGGEGVQLSPPTASKRRWRCPCAERSLVPLKSRCSRKCEASRESPWASRRASRPRPSTPNAGRADAGHRLGDDAEPAGQDGSGVRVRPTPPRRRSAHATPQRSAVSWTAAARQRRSPRPAAARDVSGVGPGVTLALAVLDDTGSATACRGRRSRRSGPGPSGRPSTSSTVSTRLPPASERSLLMCSRPSLPGIERDEGTEVGRLDDRAEVALADLRHRRVGDGVDRPAGGLGRASPLVAPM